jgi:hypothetical protein
MQVNGVDSHTLSLLCTSEPKPEPENESETGTAERKSWENDCWIYKLEPVEPQSFPVADVMLWKEENLMLEAEAMDDGDDGDDDDDDDDDHSDDLRREVGDEGEMTSHSKTKTLRVAKNCEMFVVM